jgi:lysozyme
VNRIQTVALSLSASALVGIATWEGFRSTAYIPIPGDVPTIGFGTTTGVKMGDTIDPVKALQRKIVDISKFEGSLKECVLVPLAQQEYDSYLSLAYNIGPTAFCNSTLVKKLNSQDYAGACKEILRWNRAGGKVVQGLSNRREAEYRQCIGQ